jgi:hypothetical protein
VAEKLSNSVTKQLSISATQQLSNSKKMKNRIVRGIAGTFILASILLAIYVNINWLWFTAFVGANLLQSSLTKWCLMDDILTKVFKVKD